MYTKMLEIDGVINARDLGGRTGREGATLAEQVFIRTAALHDITPKGLEQLVELGVTDIIDLRSVVEKNHNPDDFSAQPSITYHSIPMLDYMQSQIAEGGNIAVTDMEELYQEILTAHKQEFVTVFHLLAEAKGATVFHCSAGKDRTGLTAMLILAIAGVSPADIVEDYALTKPLSPHNGEDNWILYAAPETMEKTLKWLETEFGGPLNYLEQIGVHQEIQERISKKLNVPFHRTDV